MKSAILIALVSLHCLVQAQSVSFQNRTDIVAGVAQFSAPEDAAFADLNNDGHLDLVIADTGRPILTILPGIGKGRFGGPKSLKVPTSASTQTIPFSILACELSGDAFPDLVLATRKPNRLVYYQGGEGLQFKDPIETPLDRMPQDLEESDFDGDGKREVLLLAAATTSAAGEKLPAGVTLFALDTSGRFEKRSEETLPTATGYAHKADFNADGQVDIAVQVGESVTVLVNQRGAFRLVPAKSPARWAGMFSHGDFNGDGIEDIAIPCRQSKAIYILLGKGDGEFRDGPVVSTSQRTGWVAGADLDGNGRWDLITGASDGNSQLTVYLSKEGDKFEKTAEFMSVGELSFVETADLAGGGKPGILFMTATPGAAVLLQNDGLGALSRGQSIGSMPVAMKSLDADLDKIPDLAVINAVADTLTVFRRGTERAGDFSLGAIPAYIAVGDLNGDGRSDVVSANLGSKDLSVLLGKPESLFDDAKTTPVGRLVSNLTLADFNADGKPDAALAEPMDGFIQIWTGQGDGSFSMATEISLEMPMFLTAADFDSDSRTDLAVAAIGMTGTTVTLFKGKGDASFDPMARLTVPALITALAAADMNSDGNPDIVFLQQYPNGLGIALGTAGGSLNALKLTLLTTSAADLAIADFNGDGKLDIATGSDSSGRGTLLRGLGDGTFLTPSGGFGVDGGVMAAAAGDWDGDGRIDLALADAENGTIALFRNVDVTGYDLGAPTPQYPRLNFQVEQNQKYGLQSCKDPTKGGGFTVVFGWTAPQAPIGINLYSIKINPPVETLPAPEVKADGSTTTAFWSSCDVIPDSSLEGWTWTIRALDPEGTSSVPSQPAAFRFKSCRLADGTPCAGAQ